MESSSFDKIALPDNRVWEEIYIQNEFSCWLKYTYGIVKHDKIHLLITKYKTESSIDNFIKVLDSIHNLISQEIINSESSSINEKDKLILDEYFMKKLKPSNIELQKKCDKIMFTELLVTEKEHLFD